jgi:DNA-binding response OmpR family regulator
MDYLPASLLIRKTDDFSDAIGNPHSHSLAKFGFGLGCAKLVLLTEQSTNGLTALVDTLNHDFDVLVSEDRGNVRQLLELVQPDLIILDTVTSIGSDWSRIYQQIRQISYCANIPVLILTSSDQLEDRLLYLNQGAADCIAKPAARRKS